MRADIGNMKLHNVPTVCGGIHDGLVDFDLGHTLSPVLPPEFGDRGSPDDCAPLVWRSHSQWNAPGYSREPVTLPQSDAHGATPDFGVTAVGDVPRRIECVSVISALVLLTGIHAPDIVRKKEMIDRHCASHI
jgi:hypothetical protein